MGNDATYLCIRIVEAYMQGIRLTLAHDAKPDVAYSEISEDNGFKGNPFKVVRSEGTLRGIPEDSKTIQCEPVERAEDGRWEKAKGANPFTLGPRELVREVD